MLSLVPLTLADHDAKCRNMLRGAPCGRQTSPLLWLARGVAILDGASMPILAEGEEEPNDTCAPCHSQAALGVMLPPVVLLGQSAEATTAAGRARAHLADVQACLPNVLYAAPCLTHAVSEVRLCRFREQLVASAEAAVQVKGCDALNRNQRPTDSLPARVAFQSCGHRFVLQYPCHVADLRQCRSLSDLSVQQPPLTHAGGGVARRGGPGAHCLRRPLVRRVHGGQPACALRGALRLRHRTQRRLQQVFSRLYCKRRQPVGHSTCWRLTGFIGVTHIGTGLS